MIEFVFKPSRRIDGKRVVERLYSGRYAVGKGEKPVTVRLNTPDKLVASKRLRDIVVEQQQEREGIILPKSIRQAAATNLSELLGDYAADLEGLGRARKHVHDTTTRLYRMVKEMGWGLLSDVRADQFVAWRAGVQVSAKTKKEYQISLNAFLNWLVKMERLTANPLARLDKVETRGKQVRENRAFTEAEIQKLFSVAGKRKLAYQMLLYTGQRKSEVRALLWGDLHLDQTQAFALFREGTTKDKEKRAVWLRPELAEQLRAVRPANFDPTDRVFWYCWPTYDLLRGDLKRAGIERKDATGRVLHFHSFRKTWQTLGVQYGVNQRIAQEVLGHSDANLTAKIYTDVPALAMYSEMSKTPWISGDEKAPEIYAQRHAQKPVVSCREVSLADILHQLQMLAQRTGTEGISRSESLPDASCHIAEMAARAGIEPATK